MILAITAEETGTNTVKRDTAKQTQETEIGRKKEVTDGIQDQDQDHMIEEMIEKRA